MSKAKKSEFQKLLVRNPEQPVIKGTPESHNSLLGDKNKKSTSNASSIASEETKQNPGSKGKFDKPELHSTLKFSKRIDNVVKPRKTKSLSDVDKKLAVDEKVSRKVNFPYDQPVYKDLIPLACQKVQSQPVIISKVVSAHKDKEPVLADFIEQNQPKKLYYLPVHSVEQTPPITSANNLKLYELLQKCNAIT